MVCAAIQNIFDLLLTCFVEYLKAIVTYHFPMCFWPDYLLQKMMLSLFWFELLMWLSDSIAMVTCLPGISQQSEADRKQPEGKFPLRILL